MDGSQQRIGEPERARVRAALQRHATDVRLTLDELSDRLGEAEAATTQAQLAAALRHLPTLPPTRELFAAIGRLGALYHRGTLRKAEFSAQKAELLRGVAATADDDVEDALVQLTTLYHQGMLTRDEFGFAKTQLLPYA
jgi:hypothetical protein